MSGGVCVYILFVGCIPMLLSCITLHILLPFDWLLEYIYSIYHFLVALYSFHQGVIRWIFDL